MSSLEEINDNINYDETVDSQFAENQDVVEEEGDSQIPSSEEKTHVIEEDKNCKTNMVNSGDIPKN